MKEVSERQRRVGAKRLAWAALLLTLLIVAFMAYSSLTAPDPDSRPPTGTVPAQDERPRPQHRSPP